MSRVIAGLLGAALAAGLSGPVQAQVPYQLSPAQWQHIQERLRDRFHHGWPGGFPVPGFRVARLDQQFVPVKENVALDVGAAGAARQSFAAGLPDGGVEAIHAYLDVAPSGGSVVHEVRLELYEGYPQSPIAPKAQLLAAAKSTVINGTGAPQKQWVTFQLNPAVKSWMHRRFVIVLSSLALPGTFKWVGDDGNPYAWGQSAQGAFGYAKESHEDLGFKVINVK